MTITALLIRFLIFVPLLCQGSAGTAKFPILPLHTARSAGGELHSLAQAKSSACEAPEYRQLDFWIGDWDAYDFNGTTVVARVRVERRMDGCVLLEDYQDAGGQHGQSFSTYDASRKVWHQTWVTNRGRLLVIEGNFQSGEMVLTGCDPAETGESLVRGTWKPIEGGVREIGVTSRDGGTTWQPWFDLVFRPHREKARDGK